MASLIIMRARLPVVTTNGVAANSDNLKTPDPKEIYSGNAQYIFFDFGAAYEFDTAFIGYIGGAATSNAIGVNQGVNMSFTGQTGKATPTPGPTTARRRHAFAKFTAGTSRYWNISFWESFSVGIVVFGKSIQPAYGHEWGSRRGIRDMSQVTPLRGGGFGIERGARAGGYEFTCGDLTDAEVQSLYDMVEDVGESAPVVVCRDPALAQPDLNNALHYGLLDRPEAYVREAPGMNSWSFRVKDWV